MNKQYTLKEACNITGLSFSSLRHWAKEGKIKATRLDTRWQKSPWLVTLEAIKAAWDNHKINPAVAPKFPDVAKDTQ